jgi:hypothetical protein
VHAPPTAALARTLPRGRGHGGASRPGPEHNVTGLAAATHRIRQHRGPRW